MIGQWDVSTRWLRVLLIVGLIGWVVFIFVWISREPPQGAVSPEELAQAYESALNDRDAEGIAPLLGAPIAGDAATVAAFLADQPHEGQWHVEVQVIDSTTYLTVSDDRDRPVRLQAVETEGRWQVNPIPSSS